VLAAVAVAVELDSDAFVDVLSDDSSDLLRAEVEELLG